MIFTVHCDSYNGASYKFFTRALLGILFVYMLLAGAQTANAGCDAPMSQSEMNHCARLDYEAADLDLNRAYQQALVGLKPVHEEALRAAQRAWIKFRDLACESYGHQAYGGSMQPMLVNSCLAQLTKERTRMLRDQGATN